MNQHVEHSCAYDSCNFEGRTVQVPSHQAYKIKINLCFLPGHSLNCQQLHGHSLKQAYNFEEALSASTIT